MEVLLFDSGDNVSNFLIEVEPKDEKVDPMEEQDIKFMTKEWRSNRLILDKHGFKVRRGASDKVLGDEAYYLIDYGALHH